MMNLSNEYMCVYYTIPSAFLYVGMFLKLKLEENILKEKSGTRSSCSGLQNLLSMTAMKTSFLRMEDGPRNLGKQTGQESPTMCLVLTNVWLVSQDYTLLPKPCVQLSH